MGARFAEVLLLRHGIAEERSPDLEDAARVLTARGRERTQAVLERAAALGLAADQLFSSPFSRARQTAEIAVAAALAPRVVLRDALAPGADPLPLLREPGPPEAEGPRGSGRLLLVGHEPDLGLLACLLLGAPPGAITLRKAGLALLRLEGEGSAAELRLLLTPKVLLG